jgi:uncharacterized protein YecT (DUF1311 family)
MERALRTRLLILPLALGIACHQAHADDCSTVTCRQAIDCTLAVNTAADHQLNATYRTLLEKLKDSRSRTTRLVADERAWIRQRDARCQADVESLYLNSTEHSNTVAKLDYLREATTKHIMDLASTHDYGVCSLNRRRTCPLSGEG